MICTLQKRLVFPEKVACKANDFSFFTKEKMNRRGLLCGFYTLIASNRPERQVLCSPKSFYQIFFWTKKFALCVEFCFFPCVRC